MCSWDEAEHPRDEEGKFTYKNGGESNTSSNTTLYGGIEYNNEQVRKNILYKDTSSKENLSKYRNKLVYFLGNNLDRAETLYSTAAELENKILDNTISRIKVSREKISNSINNLSKNELKSNSNFKNIIKKAKNTYNTLNDFEVKANNMFKINTKKGQNGFGEEAISSVLRFQKSLEKDCNEIVMTAKNIENQTKRKENNLINTEQNKRNEMPVNQIIKNETGQKQDIEQPQIKQSQKMNVGNNDKAPSSEKVNNWIMPCEGRISSPYGWRIHPIYKEKRFHNGIDIAVPVGTDIKSIADGKVYFAGKGDPKGYAHFIIIDHGIINGINITSEYGHISQHLVKNGQKVKRGQVIAKSGNEGKSSGPHLHLTIREGVYKGKHVQPGKYVKY